MLALGETSNHSWTGYTMDMNHTWTHIKRGVYTLKFEVFLLFLVNEGKETVKTKKNKNYTIKDRSKTYANKSRVKV